MFHTLLEMEIFRPPQSRRGPHFQVPLHKQIVALGNHLAWPLVDPALTLQDEKLSFLL